MVLHLSAREAKAMKRSPPNTTRFDDDDSSMASLKSIPTLEFHDEIVSELLQRDGITVLAEGLGMATVLAVLIKKSHEEAIQKEEERKETMERFEKNRKKMRKKKEFLIPGQKAEDGSAAGTTASKKETNEEEEEETTITNPKIVIVVGASETLRTATIREYERLYPEVLHAPLDVTADVSMAIRARNYAMGTPCFVTSRIFAVDLLGNRLPAENVAGMIVANAHSVEDISGEGFCARLFREKNRRGFMRGLTDRPYDASKAFEGVERSMKSLFVRNVTFWPRFRMNVKSCLDPHEPNVIELRQEMTEDMKKIQEAIVNVMDQCMKELRKSDFVDVAELTVQSSLFKSFDTTVSRQLEPMWNIVPRKTKQLVRDLRTLRRLADLVLKVDAVSFLKHCEMLKATERHDSLWMLADAAGEIFKRAKDRVYRLKRKPIQISKQKKEELRALNIKEEKKYETIVVPTCEPMPKWTLLEEVIQEIRENVSDRKLSKDDQRIVVAAKDERAVRVLELVLAHGSEKVSNAKWENFLKSRVGKASTAAKVQQQQLQQEQQTAKGRGRGGRGGNVYSASYGRGGRGGRGQRASGPGIGRGGFALGYNNSQGQAGGFLMSANERDALAKEATRRAEEKKHRRKLERLAARPDVDQSSLNLTEEQNNDDEKAAKRSKDDEEIEEDEVILASQKNRNEGIYFVPIDARDPSQLSIYAPTYVVAYDPDAAFIRELEVFAASRPQRKLTVYFLVHDNSTEEEKYLAAIKRETAAFERLFMMKQHMAVPEEQEGRLYELDEEEKEEAEEHARQTSANPMQLAMYRERQMKLNKPLFANDALDLKQKMEQDAVSTRKAGGRVMKRLTLLHVVVDIREFMSTLPAVLHQCGYTVLPCTLEVGDYVLSPDICVERKAIPDLVQSLKSGRLYAQAEAMCKHYKTPILLIEFDKDRSFALQPKGEIPAQISPDSLQSKLTLLILKFPKLRIIWSPNQRFTARVFAGLKKVEDEPTIEKATRVGVPENFAKTAEGEDDEDNVDEHGYNKSGINQAAVNFLRKLPGVTSGNYRNVMRHCRNIQEIGDKTMEELQTILGDNRRGKLLYDFLRFDLTQFHDSPDLPNAREVTDEMRRKIVELGEKERKERLEAWKKQREEAASKTNVSKTEIDTLD